MFIGIGGAKQNDRFYVLRFVIPANAGIQFLSTFLDSRFRGNDIKKPVILCNRRRRSSTKQDGSVTIWLAGIFPILVIILCILVNVILMIDARLVTQAAIDRGAYAGASYLSHVMNEVAKLNWRFRKEYRDREAAFDSYSEEKKKWIEEQIRKLNHDQGVLHDKMVLLLESGYARAHEIAKEVTFENLSGVPHVVPVGYKFFYGNPDETMFNMVNDGPEGGPYANKRVVIPTEIVGVSIDPNKYEHHSYKVYKYLIKNEEYYVALVAGVAAMCRLPLLPKYLGGQFLIHALAAAQPYGGSIKDFSFVEAGDADAAESGPRGSRLLYHPALIPIRAAREDLNVLH